MSYAKNVVSRTMHGTFQELSFAARVRNVGFGKRVAFHIGAGEDGVLDRNARRIPRRAAGRRRDSRGPDLAVPLTRDFRHSGKHPVRGVPRTRRAEAVGQPGEAELPSRRGFGRDRVRAADVLALWRCGAPAGRAGVAAGGSGGAAGVAPEAVIVHWTDDGWATQHATPAYFRRNHWDRRIGSNARNPNRYGWGVWAARLPLRQAYRVEFAVDAGRKRARLGQTAAASTTARSAARSSPDELNLHTYLRKTSSRNSRRSPARLRERGIDLVCFQEGGEHWNDGAGDDWAPTPPA
jgi:maltose 6'-phosphate phosphatase